jgi:hypothetical protein
MTEKDELIQSTKIQNHQLIIQAVPGIFWQAENPRRNETDDVSFVVSHYLTKTYMLITENTDTSLGNQHS